MPCPECRFSYAEQLPSNRRIHDKYHDEALNGIPWNHHSREKTVWSEWDELGELLRSYQEMSREERYAATEKLPSWIYVINSRSPIELQRRAEKFISNANMETRYDFPQYVAGTKDRYDAHVFLYYKHETGRIVGAVKIERRFNVQWFDWQEWKGAGLFPTEDHPGLWTLGYLAVVKNHRREGVARKLVQEGCRELGVKVEEVGWLMPFTEAGELFARSVCPKGFNAVLSWV